MMKKLKRLLIVGAAVIMMAVSLSGCTSNPNEVEVGASERFERVYYQSDDIPGYIHVYVDTETGVMYLFVKDGYGGGLTVMVDENGKPMIWEEQK